MSNTTTRATRTKPTEPAKPAKPAKRAQTATKAPGSAAGQDSVDHMSARPKYEQVAEQLRDLIDSGQLSPAALLPSEAQLMDRYGVSRPTARAAIAALRTQGLVTVIKGKGAFVRRSGDRPTHTHHRTISHTPTTGNARSRAASRASYADDDTDRDDWREVETPSTYWVNATPALALAIGVAEHTPLFGCDRLLEDPAGRRVLHRLYLPFTTAADIPDLETDPFVTPGRLYTLLANAGHQLAWTEYVTARNPTPDDTTTLRIPTATPIITTRRITHTTNPDTPEIPGTPGSSNPQILAMEETRRNAEDTQLAYTIPITR